MPAQAGIPGLCLNDVPATLQLAVSWSRLSLLCIILLVLLWWLSRPEPLPALAVSGDNPSETDVNRGEYLVNIAGCVSCHTDADNGGAHLAGGVKLETPFGNFIAPNITSDRETGIGGWSFADFARAMHLGITPAGARYYPAFPYTSYTQIDFSDLRAMYDYLQTTPPVERPNEPHEIPWHINRALLPAWQALFFEPGVFRPDAVHDESLNRGAYIVNALTHCGECHTPRNLLGAIRPGLFLAGSDDGPDGDPVPNITSSEADGIGDWDDDELILYLEEGELPDGDYAGGAMVDVIDNSTGLMNQEDLQAVVRYILSVPAVEN